jgi:muramoyltetrapeptide carboxypeptidase
MEKKIKKLKQGDKIQVITPASSLKSIKIKKIKKSIKLLESLGFKVSFGKNVYENGIFGSSSVKSRVNDLHKAFEDKKVSAILCAQGGYNSNELLPYIDWNIIKNNPKPIIGYSDITVLVNAIYAKTGLITYVGPTFSTLGATEEKGILKYIADGFMECLGQEKPFIIKESKYFNERKVKAKKSLGLLAIQKGRAQGIIIGGNLCSLNLLKGTDYMPHLKDAILFIEEDDFGGKLTPMEFSRNLESLLQMKDADTIKGIVFGRFQKGANMTIEKIKLILSTKKVSKNIPIAYNADFGHTMPRATFPVGGIARVEVSESRVVVEIVKH